MKRPILIIMFLLLCPSLTSAGEEDGVVEESKMNYIENIIASNKIARDIFIHEAYSIYADPIRLSALLSATGYKNLSAEVMNDVGIVDTFDINWFSKHSKKYEYDESDKKMLESVEISFGQFVNGYTAGVHETYINILRMYEDAANYLRLIAPQMYENYLDEKKERQRERK